MDAPNQCKPTVSTTDSEVVRTFISLTKAQAVTVLASEKARESYNESDETPGALWSIVAYHDKAKWEAQGDPFDMPVDCGE